MKNIERLFDGYSTLQAWKIAGLFFAVRDETGVPDPLNPNFQKRAGFSAARNVLLRGLPVKLPTQDSMIGAKYSPLVYDGTRIVNELSGNSIPARDFPLKVPSSITDLVPTASGSIGIMTYKGCNMFDERTPCEFCTLGSARDKGPLSEGEVIRQLDDLSATGYRFSNIAINTGQYGKSGDELILIAKMADRIKVSYDVKIAAEVGPFAFLKEMARLDEYLETMQSIDTFMINIELANDDARMQLCPGKPKQADYLKVFEGLRKSDRGITTVLQLNFYPELEKIDDVTDFLSIARELGVVPELLVSRAVIGSRLKDAYWQSLSSEIPRDYAYQLMDDRLGLFLDRLEKIRYAAPSISAKAGCATCGMCNLNDLVV